MLIVVSISCPTNILLTTGDQILRNALALEWLSVPFTDIFSYALLITALRLDTVIVSDPFIGAVIPEIVYYL